MGFLLLWLVAAYLLLPMGWRLVTSRRPSFNDSPRVTETGTHHPGDPLNVCLIGSEAEVESTMQAAGWSRATALGLRSDFKIVVDSALSRPDPDAPVSSLYLFGRRQDLAFEQPVGNSPRRRHHVRLWRMDRKTSDGRTKWIGSAVYDKHVGLSRTTGQITHVTGPDVDAERDYLFKCLEGTALLADMYIVQDFHLQLHGTNGGGDPWHTDGGLCCGVIAQSNGG